MGGGGPAQGAGRGPAAPPAPGPSPPAAAVRGAERGPERRGSALPPSMRILGVGKGAGEANGDSVRILVCSSLASCRP